LPGPVALECLKPIAGQDPQGIEGRSSVQNRKPPFRPLLEALERPDMLTLRKSFCAPVLAAQDHE
jgi:hypothetical protein